MTLLQPLPPRSHYSSSRLAREEEETTETTSPELQRTGAKSSNAGRLWRCRRRRRRRRSAAALQWAVVVVAVAGQLSWLLPLLALGDESSSTARPARRAFEVQKALALSPPPRKTPEEFLRKKD
jgi:ferric-dicitrate binding protein FerR (iron transport regulator)